MTVSSGKHVYKVDPPRWFATDRLIFTGKTNIAENPDLVKDLNRTLEEFGFQLIDDSNQENSEEAEAVNLNCYSQSYIIPENNSNAEVTSFIIQSTDPEEQVREHQIVDAITVLERTHIGNNSEIIAVSPNWLITSSPPEPGAVGGPGAWPQKWTDTGEPPYHVQFYPRKGDAKWILGSDPRPEDAQQAPLSETRPVTVVILDTSPGELPSSNTENEFLKQLRKKLNFHTDPQIEAQLTELTKAYIVPLDHDYDMVSHGLFVAGLVHDIIPTANIHLIRVLNKYGMGTLETVRQGIQFALDSEQIDTNNAWVLNLSLNMIFPYPELINVSQWLAGSLKWEDLWAAVGHEHKWRIDELMEHRDKRREKRPPLRLPTTFTERLRYPLEVPLRDAYDRGAVLIAAAGNERRSGQTEQPLTLYPAAFNDVIGVGALKKVTKPTEVTELFFSDFSCSVDKPSEEGFAVMGGNAIQMPVEPATNSTTASKASGENPTESDDAKETQIQRDPPKPMITEVDDSVIGLWLGKYPQDDPTISAHTNISWAHWSGTSFSAPIVSGALAKILSYGYDRDTAVEMLRVAWEEMVTEPNSRAETPQVVIARQVYISESG